jgi:hypothetical protein
MRKTAICLMCLFVIIVSCEKKTDRENSVHVNLVFDTIIAYPNDSIWTSFHLDINPNDPSYIIEWSAPADFTNNSICHLSLNSNSTLKFIIKNSAGKKLVSFASTILIDSILTNPKYDYRNYYEGDYLFNIHHIYYSSSHPIGVDTVYIVSGSVKKDGTLNSSFLSFNYGPKILWTGYPLNLFNYSTLSVSPNNILSHPGESGGYYDPHSFGKFVNYDSLIYTIGIYGPAMIHDAIYILGSKK